MLFDQMAAQSAVINDDDVPAWELWVNVLRPHSPRLLDAGAPHVEPPIGGVVCWVPESLVDEAQRGVEVVAADSLQWISDLCAPADTAHRLQALFGR
ncbi:MAG: hypothetical protein KF838_00815 [Phycisphaeraceae bacterium]|nr:MAG: hypothetical protein KF838_00815 [Phycisphaeraceae bacterium]